MENTRFLDRREFTAEAVLAMLSGVAILVSEAACGGSGYSSPTSPAPQPAGGSDDKVGQISNNHGHSAVLHAAQILAGDQVQLDIRGTASHTHTVTVSHDQLASIGGGATVAMTSTTTNGHDHTVTFNPATSPGTGPGY